MSRKSSSVRSPADPRRSGLSREALLEAGLEITPREDLQGLTIRKLAEVFDVTAMAIYRHFRNKDELIDGVLDRFVREADITNHGIDTDDWRSWLRATFTSIYESLVETPGVVPLLGTSYRFGPAGMQMLEEVLTVLCEAGFDEDAAVQTFYALMSYTMGASGLSTSWRLRMSEFDRTDSEESERLARVRFEGASRHSHPHTVLLAPALARSMHAPPFATGLDGLLESFERALNA